ncbi:MULTISPECIES: glycosyltransferase family 2 protein [unclassified Sutcliffiella]|uniref:glycosyltransferase family 2 protein n=1 Tax=unclassified Sutcliffiella TaxID=2837532 RepID=UPI0030CE72F6
MGDYIYSICILTLNHINITKKCLQSLLKSKINGKTELIIVDNGSSDGTVEWLLSFKKIHSDDNLSITIVLNDENKGCTGGRNQAMSIAKGEFIVIVDNDVEFIEENWLIELHQYYLINENIGIIGPKLNYACQPSVIQSAGLEITETGKVIFLGEGQHETRKEFNTIKEVDAYQAACWLFKKSIIEKIGLFDEAFFPVQYEDIDYCFRVRDIGLKIIYYPYVKVLHHQHITTKQTNQLNYSRITVKNGMLFRKKWKHIFAKNKGNLHEGEIV